MTTGDDNAALPVAGWYPDTANPDRERLWTGERWIDWVRPLKAGRTEEVPTGWYPDAGQEGFERLWAGEMWTEEVRRTPPAGVVEAPAGVGTTAHPVGSPAATEPASQAATPPGRQPPVPVPGASVSYHDSRVPDRLRLLGTLVMVGLGVSVAAGVAQLIADQSYIGTESEMIDGRLSPYVQPRPGLDAVHTTYWTGFAAGIITAILFLIWFYRAYRNLVRAGISDVRFAPGWAVGGWFIPIFNAIRQKKIANDVWKASTAAGTVGIARWREMPLSGVLNWWWGTWVTAGVLGFIGRSVISRANSDTLTTLEALHRQRAGLWWTQVALACGVAAGLLAILFVREVTRLQDKHF